MINASYRTTAEQIDQTNASGRTPVVFIHGLCSRVASFISRSLRSARPTG